MNLFKVEFYQGKTDAADYNQVKHSLVDTAANRKIISLSVSSEKLMSVSNYTREPRRVTFECFPTAWIQDYILSGDYEHDRYISHYEVKIYRDNVLFFTGIIVTSNISYDVASGILKFTCYDKIKLLSIFSDLTHNYNLTAGYLPAWVLSYFIQDIAQAIPVNIPIQSQFSIPTLSIPMGAPLTIARVEYNDMATLPSGSGWQAVFQETSWASPLFGYIVYAPMNKISFVFGHYVCFDAYPASPRYRAYYRARILTFHNSICPVVKEYDEDTGWIEASSFSTVGDGYAKLMAFFTDNGISEATLNSLSSTGSLDSRAYGRSHLVNSWVEATCYGNLYPSKIQLGKGYETNQDEDTENLKALQAMLMFYNATVYTDAFGRIILANKGTYSATVVEIDDDDVVSMSVKRGNQEVPDMATLDVLAGDSEQLHKLIRQHLIAFYGNKWSIDVVIDQLSKYNLALQGKIQIRDEVYAITELERDYINDEYKVKAWQL